MTESIKTPTVAETINDEYLQPLGLALLTWRKTSMCRLQESRISCTAARKSLLTFHSD